MPSSQPKTEADESSMLLASLDVCSPVCVLELNLVNHHIVNPARHLRADGNPGETAVAGEVPDGDVDTRLVVRNPETIPARLDGL